MIQRKAEKWGVELTPQVNLTKREYFAGMAMMGILANRELQIAISQCAQSWSNRAVEEADALIEELDKNK